MRRLCRQPPARGDRRHFGMTRPGRVGGKEHSHMSDALIGVAGVIVGATLGGTGKYFTARKGGSCERLVGSGRCSRAPRGSLQRCPGGRQQRNWELNVGVTSPHARGIPARTFPNGFKAAGWLCLAGKFARLKELDPVRRMDGSAAWWRNALRTVARLEPDPDQDPADKSARPRATAAEGLRGSMFARNRRVRQRVLNEQSEPPRASGLRDLQG